MIDLIVVARPNVMKMAVTVTDGTNTPLRAKPERIAEIPGPLGARTTRPIPRWDGHAGERAAAVPPEHLGG